MLTTRDERPDVERDAEIDVTHFIPSVQLKGTRADKLETLDLLIAHLEGLRRSIAEHRTPPAEWNAGPSMQLTPADRWWGVGLVIAAALVVIMLGVRACAATNDISSSNDRGRAGIVPQIRAKLPESRRAQGAVTISLPSLERLVTAAGSTVFS